MKKRISHSLLFLLFLFLCQILSAFATSNYNYMHFMEYHKVVLFARLTVLLSGPVLYLYARQTLNKSTKYFYLHYMPFGIAVILSSFHISGIQDYIIWKSPLSFWLNISGLIQNLTYTGLCFHLILSDNKNFHNLLENLKKNPVIVWVQFLTVGFIWIWFVQLYCFSSYMVVKKPGWCAHTNSIFALAVFAFIGSIMFLLLLKPDIFLTKQKYISSKLSANEKAKINQQLMEYIQAKKPFLNPEITLGKMASDMNISSHKLSQIINETSNMTFRDFINKHRIEEAKKQLIETKEENTYISEIFYSVGFNTKSVFNTTFKKFTGMTPTEFQKI